MAAGTSPTGALVGDLIWPAALGALVVLAGARARRWSLLVLAAGAAMAAGGAAGLPAAVALALVVGGLVVDRRSRLVNAVAAGLAVQSVLRLPDLGPRGTSAALAALLVAPVLVSGYRNASQRNRSRVRRGMAVASVAVAAIVLALGVAALESRSDLGEGLTAAQEGFDALRVGDVDRGVALLDASAGSLDRAHAGLSSPLAAPARVVPLLGPHVTAGREVAEVGRHLSATAARVAAETDLDQLRVEGAGVDLAAVGALEGPAARARREVTEAEARLAAVQRTWLLAPVDGAVADLGEEVAATGTQLDTLLAGVDAAPWLLGADAVRRYLVLFANPAEARGGGGFVGSYGVLEARAGRLELVHQGRIGELERAPGWEERTLSGPADFLTRYGRYYPTRYLKNITASPDFPTVGSVLAELYPQAVPGERLDGVLYLDPFALAALLEVTGPVTVDGLDEPLDASNAADLLLKQQYTRFPDPEARADLLGAAAQATFDALRGTMLDSPADLATSLAPAARKGRFRVWVTDPAAEHFLTRLGITGELPAVDGGDILSVRTANAAANKLDAYLARTIDYAVTVDTGTGQVDGTATVTLENRAPAGLPDYVAGNADRRAGAGPPAGTAIVVVSAYSDLALAGATLGGEPLPVEVQEELGHHVYSAKVEVARGESVTIEFALAGTATLPYHLTVSHQPLVVPDVVRLSARPRGGGSVQRLAVAAGDAVTEWEPRLR